MSYPKYHLSCKTFNCMFYDAREFLCANHLMIWLNYCLLERTITNLYMRTSFFPANTRDNARKYHRVARIMLMRIYLDIKMGSSI